MESLKTLKIIFSITGQCEALVRANFYEECASAGIIPYPLYGVYKDEYEFSWALTYEDFLKVPLRFLAGQESVLAVTKCNKQYATLFFLEDGKITQQSRTAALGSMVQVSGEEAVANGDYTLDPKLGIFFVAKKENPDRMSRADREATDLWNAIDGLILAHFAGENLWGTLQVLINEHKKQRPPWLEPFEVPVKDPVMENFMQPSPMLNAVGGLNFTD